MSVLLGNFSTPVDLAFNSNQTQLFHETHPVLHSPGLNDFIINYAVNSDRVELDLFPGWRLASERALVCTVDAQPSYNYNLVSLAK